jgi:formylglycine-generating enzyme required for sulfatase activity
MSFTRFEKPHDPDAPPKFRFVSYQPNPWGFYQIHGNVWEWTEDCYHDSYNGAPVDGSAWITSDCKGRVFRGGSFGSEPEALRAAVRSWNRPTPRSFANMTNIGFRVARTLSP